MRFVLPLAGFSPPRNRMMNPILLCGINPMGLPVRELHAEDEGASDVPFRLLDQIENITELERSLFG